MTCGSLVLCDPLNFCLALTSANSGFGPQLNKTPSKLSNVFDLVWTLLDLVQTCWVSPKTLLEVLLEVQGSCDPHSNECARQ